MLFLGEYCTFSASASDIFHDSKFRGNCIFITDLCSSREEDGGWKSGSVGVFDLGTGKIGHIGIFDGYPDMFWPPPDWVYETAFMEADLNQRLQNIVIGS